MVMLKGAYNRYAHGGWLSYWFKFPTSFFVWEYRDQQITNALAILNLLLKEEAFTKGQWAAWFYEFYAYVNMVAGNKELAKQYFEKAIASAPKQSDPYQRSMRMLEQLKKA